MKRFPYRWTSVDTSLSPVLSANYIDFAALFKSGCQDSATLLATYDNCWATNPPDVITVYIYIYVIIHHVKLLF